MPKKPSVTGTGLSGLVGSRVVELLKEKYSFKNLDLTTGVDITDPKSLNRALRNSGGEIVLHLAAFTNVDEAYKQRGNTRGSCYRINVLGTRNVARVCAEKGKYLIHISTDFVFDGEKQSEYTEKDSPNPIEWYGHTKYLAEKEVEKAGGKHTIARIAFPFRARFPQKPDVVRTILAKLKENSLHPMFADQTITPTFIDDIAGALDVMMKKRPQGTYHIVGSSQLSPFALAKKIARGFGFDDRLVKKGSLEKYLQTANRPYQMRLALSNKKAKSKLGISMSTIDRALRRLMDQQSPL